MNETRNGYFIEMLPSENRNLKRHFARYFKISDVSLSFQNTTISPKSFEKRIFFSTTGKNVERFETLFSGL